MKKGKIMTWNIEEVERNLEKAFDENSEQKLLDLLKKNTFLFYELVERKYTMQPIFHEVEFGNKYRCDFLWLSDRSDYPQWVLVEIEKPQGTLFNQNKSVSNYLKKGIEQVDNWRRYFAQYPSEKERIFKAKNLKFRYILIIGNKEEWEKTEFSKNWRAYNDEKIEIRTMDVFKRAIENLKKNPKEFFCFEENPITKNSKELEKYIEKNSFTRFLG
ncbi:DUF4263 domain-containing protein [Leptotrichia sp. HMT-225]|jgi:hypothetical protein|uniref:Shedu anti-phage system protein SduA domain-containing protein n=2 Tax=unclassified Leptotrichia TaxID=2633022 RepID=UPI0003AE7CD2|nr:Shedu anti-phage system protein SduA domain-containing protein [Leptotrichia sp. HMT-225]ERL25943.1 hypothetical protein HMPREF9108_01512 [Leptotrichia sp. oral taxon 225 str. F0581]WLD74299.1 DUF4263 domain-containing protein [Leptotrichia sp. HMT-225]